MFEQHENNAHEIKAKLFWIPHEYWSIIDFLTSWGKKITREALPKVLSLLCNTFDKFILFRCTSGRFYYHMTFKLHPFVKNCQDNAIYTLHCFCMFCFRSKNLNQGSRV